MHRLAFLSRVAFLCNICLLLTWLMRYYVFIPKGQAESTIIIAGLVLSFLMNGLVNILYGLLLLRKIPLQQMVPVWLAAINFFFLILQLYLILSR